VWGPPRTRSAPGAEAESPALAATGTPEDKGWKAQRQALLVAWLGEALAARAGHLVQHGFIHAARQDRFHPPDLLDGPLGAWEDVEMLGPLGEHAWIADRCLSLLVVL